MANKINKFLYITLFLLILNLGLSAYLAYEFYFPDPNSICSINAIFDCASVAESGYAVLFGIPIAVLGVFFYAGFSALVLGALFGFPFNKIHKKITTELIYAFMRFLAYFGVAFSLALTYIEAFVIHVYCPFCLAQQFVIIIIAIVLILAKKAMNKAKKEV